jgi:hypothetical protein
MSWADGTESLRISGQQTYSRIASTADTVRFFDRLTFYLLEGRVAMTLNANKGHGGLGCGAVVLALAMSVACSDAAPITGPGGLPNPAQPAPAGSVVVRGVIFEDLPVSPDMRLAPGVPVRVFGGGRVVEATSGADGSFLADVPETAPFVRVVAAGPLYFTPCPAFRSGENARVAEPLEVRVVSGAVLSKTGSPKSYSADRVAWGSVSERTSAGLQPVSGATVTMLGTASLENPLAVTLTDARGFYTICFPSRSANYDVEVRKEGYAPASRPPVIGWDFETTDFVLTRR